MALLRAAGGGGAAPGQSLPCRTSYLYFHFSSQGSLLEECGLVCQLLVAFELVRTLEERGTELWGPPGALCAKGEGQPGAVHGQEVLGWCKVALGILEMGKPGWKTCKYNFPSAAQTLSYQTGGTQHTRVWEPRGVLPAPAPSPLPRSCPRSRRLALGKRH